MIRYVIKTTINRALERRPIKSVGYPKDSQQNFNTKGAHAANKIIASF